MALNDLLNLGASLPAGSLARITSSTLVGTPGKEQIAQNPQHLARQAGTDLNTYALARMVASEGYGGRNDVGRRGEIMAKIVQVQVGLNSKGSVDRLVASIMRDGTFGRQGRVAPGTTGAQYAATSKDPSALDLAIVKAVLAGGISDFSQGAKNFLSPGAYKNGMQAGIPLPNSFLGQLAKWKVAWVGEIPGVDFWHFAAFKPSDAATRAQQNAAAAVMYDKGLARQNRPAPWNAEAIAAAVAKGSGIIGILALFGALGLFIYRRYYG